MHNPQIHAALLIAIFASIATFAITASAQDRLPPIPADKWSPAQKKAAADYKDLRKQDLTAPPWSVLLRVPDYVMPSLELRIHNQINSALSPKLTEFAILLAARHLTSNFEWTTHTGPAAKAGVSPAIIAAVAEGRRPERMAEDEEVLYDFCTELLHNQSVSDPTYARAVAKFGEPGVVEAASLEGYYTFLAMVMNAARSPLAGGAKPALESFPQH